ncbi:MAG: hypothetical protein FWF78_10535 [Defluviitaleaceae bacterium]|nr:hypothetical protein [Defluviitaleaceae bacterium]
MGVLQPESVNIYNLGIIKSIKHWGGGAFASYTYQILETLNFSPESVLVIGQGDNIVPSILRGIIEGGITVDTFDIVKDMKPTYCGDIRKIDEIVTKPYDVILCCEVLEHLPFVEFEPVLQKISKLCKHGVVLSLPIFGFSGCLKVSLPKIRFTIPIAVPFYKFGKKTVEDSHHWEINDGNGVKKSMVVQVLKNTYTIQKHYRCKDVPYHMYFILKPKE